MSYREKDIAHENGDFWVLSNRYGYHVMRSGITHSIGDSSYSLDDNGLSLAVARCDYLAKRKALASCQQQ